MKHYRLFTFILVLGIIIGNACCFIGAHYSNSIFQISGMSVIFFSVLIPWTFLFIKK